MPPRSTDSRQPPSAASSAATSCATDFDLLVVDADDDIAALDAEPRRRRLVLDVEHHDAVAHVVVDADLWRDRGRDVGDLAAGQRMAAFEIARVARRVLDRGDQRDGGLDLLPFAQHAELGRAADRPW